jgi:hypothetical protein
MKDKRIWKRYRYIHVIVNRSFPFFIYQSIVLVVHQLVTLSFEVNRRRSEYLQIHIVVHNCLISSVSNIQIDKNKMNSRSNTTVSSAKNKSKDKQTTRSGRAGLTFPIGRVLSFF